jgi:hypothetical protein
VPGASGPTRTPASRWSLNAPLRRASRSPNGRRPQLDHGPAVPRDSHACTARG